MIPFNKAQAKMIPEMAGRDLTFLMAGMGVGKSRAAIAVAPYGALIIAPAAAVELSWPAEVARWSPLPYYKLNTAAGVAAWGRGEPAFYGASYDIMTRLWPSPPVDTLLYDESHMLKNPSGRRSKAWRAVKYWEHFQRRIAMTGTPRPKGLWELFNQVRHLDGGARLGKSYTKFEKQYFALRRNYFHAVVERTPFPHAEQEILGKISDITTVLRKEDYLDLQPLEVEDIYVTLPPALMQQYRKLKKTLVLSLPTGTITAHDTMGVTNKLLQFTGGYIYSGSKDDGDWRPHPVHTIKADAVAELMKSTRALVIAKFHEERRRLQERLGLPALDDASVAAWNARKIRGIVAAPVASLNLQHGGDTLIWHTLPWSTLDYDQTNARLHRTGQTSPVKCYRIIAEGTIDEVIAEVLRRRLSEADATLVLLETLK